jgi:hypothetical protein
VCRFLFIIFISALTFDIQEGTGIPLAGLILPHFKPVPRPGCPSVYVEILFSSMICGER